MLTAIRDYGLEDGARKMSTAIATERAGVLAGVWLNSLQEEEHAGEVFMSLLGARTERLRESLIEGPHDSWSGRLTNEVERCKADGERKLLKALAWAGI